MFRADGATSYDSGDDDRDAARIAGDARFAIHLPNGRCGGIGLLLMFAGLGRRDRGMCCGMPCRTGSPCVVLHPPHASVACRPYRNAAPLRACPGCRNLCDASFVSRATDNGRGTVGYRLLMVSTSFGPTPTASSSQLRFPDLIATPGAWCAAWPHAVADRASSWHRCRHRQMIQENT